RHTRWPRDWSSDVCSSDLAQTEGARIGDRQPARRSDRRGVIRLYLITPLSGDPVRAVEAALAVLPRDSTGVQLRQPDLSARELRSEERRVGKGGEPVVAWA